MKIKVDPIATYDASRRDDTSVPLGTLLSRTPTGDPFVANVDQVADVDYPKMKLSLRSRDYLPPGFKPLSLISPLSLASRIYSPIFSQADMLRYNAL